MGYPQPVYYPPFNVTRAGHMVLTSRDLAKARDFYSHVLGLVVTAEDANTLYFRGIEEIGHHSLIIERTTSAPTCRTVGLRVLHEDELDKAHRHFSGLGLKSQWADVPFQGKTLRVTDPFGIPLEFCARMDRVPRHIMTSEHHGGGAPLRFDHLQVHATDIAKVAEFYTALGFRTSDYVVRGNTDELVGAFLHRKDIPWDIVFLRGTGPRMHHLAYVVHSAADMFRACDTAGNSGFGRNVEFGPGRHAMGHVLFTYFRDPDGHRVELCPDAPHQMTDAECEPVRWDDERRKTMCDWGNPPPRRWFEEASHFQDVEPVAMPRQPGRMALEEYLETFVRA
jgi:catechol 2,3-dioxygenase